jgi:glutamate-1-semialdehyde 2,1-aminomutase
MGAMQAFLERLETPDIRSLYANLDATWNARAEHLNSRLEIEDLPVRVANLSSIWTVTYTRPCAYNWMLQYYLRAEGIALSWVGTGRFIFSLDYTPADFAEVANRFVAAARAMERGGWWADVPGLTNKRIRRNLLKAFLAARLGLRDEARGAEAPRDEALPDAASGRSA